MNPLGWGAGAGLALGLRDAVAVKLGCALWKAAVERGRGET